MNNYTCYASRMFDYAIKIGLISQNPFKLLSSFKISKIKNHRRIILAWTNWLRFLRPIKRSLKIIWRLPCTLDLGLAKFGA
ncbi:hypothetical protein QM027_00095 [Campylobacter concisus]